MRSMVLALGLFLSHTAFAANCAVRLETNADSLKIGELNFSLMNRGYSIVTDSSSATSKINIQYKTELLSGKCHGIEIGQLASCQVSVKVKSPENIVLYEKVSISTGCINGFESDYKVCPIIDQEGIYSLPNCTPPMETIPNFHPIKEESKAAHLDLWDTVPLGNLSYTLTPENPSPTKLIASDLVTKSEKWKVEMLGEAWIAEYKDLTIAGSPENGLRAFKTGDGTLLWSSMRTVGASFIVSSDALFATARSKYGTSRVIVAFSVKTGNPVWESESYVGKFNSQHMEEGIITVRSIDYDRGNCYLSKFAAQNGSTVLSSKQTPCNWREDTSAIK